MKNKTNFIAIVFVACVGIALAITNDWISLETFKETSLAVISVILSIYGLWQTLSKNEIAQENKEIKSDFEKKVGITHREFKMIKNK